jgi:ParB-like chromosome segregation protein Spo0J
MPELYVPPTEFSVELIQGGVKAALAQSGAKTRDLLMVPIDQLKVVAGLNVRIHDDEYEEHIEEIKNSIMEHGFYPHKALSGYVGKEGESTFIYVTGGFTRLEAAKRAAAAGAPIEALPVILRAPGTSMADLMIALAVDNTGTPLRPYEKAIVAKRLMSFGMDEETVAKKLSITINYLKELLYLMGLPHGLQAMVTTGKAAAGHVITLARKVGPKEALRALEASVPAPATGEGASAESGSEEPARVTPRQTAATARAKNPIVPKKKLFSAIDYAIALPSGGIEWLARWRKGEEEAVKELDSYKPPRKNSNPKKTAKSAAGNGKRGRPKKEANGAADDDVFDTSKRKAKGEGRRPAADDPL